MPGVKLSKQKGFTKRNVTSPPEEADEDEPVKPREIRNLRETFWNHKHHNFTHDAVNPGDKLIGRLYREHVGRTLKVPSLAKAASIKGEAGQERIQQDFRHGFKITLKDTLKARLIASPEAWLEALAIYANALCIVGSTDVDKPPTDEQGRKRSQRREDPPCLFTKLFSSRC